MISVPVEITDEAGFQRIDCPYCAEVIEIFIDSSVPDQEYIEDCQVCCRPITIRTELCVDENIKETIRVSAIHENEY